MFDSTVQMKLEAGSKMKLQIWVNGFFFVAVLLQVKSSAGDDPKANLTALQEKVEALIEAVLVGIQQYYEKTEKEFKCLPERYTTELMNTVRDGIDCVEKSHKQFQDGDINFQKHRTEFHSCFTKAKNRVMYILQNVNPAENNCPPKVVEKTFQINVTTSYTKTFNLNIQNGVEVVYNKTIQVTRNEEPCRNYPDLFSHVEKPERTKKFKANPVSGILHPGSGRRTATQVDTDELTTSLNLNAGQDVTITTAAVGTLKQNHPKGEVAYAYFHEFRNGGGLKDRRERSGEPEVRRKTQGHVFKGRQTEGKVTV